MPEDGTAVIEPDGWMGMAFGCPKTATAVIKPDGRIHGWIDRWMDIRLMLLGALFQSL